MAIFNSLVVLNVLFLSNFNFNIFLIVYVGLVLNCGGTRYVSHKKVTWISCSMESSKTTVHGHSKQ